MTDRKSSPRPSYTRSLRTRVLAARYPALPTSRISEVLMAFAQPALDELGSESDLPQVRAAMDVVVSIWNAHVLALPVWGTQPELERLAARVASGLLPTHMVDLFAVLSDRRQELFADDPRYITEVNVERDVSGHVHVSCEAKIPHALHGTAR